MDELEKCKSNGLILSYVTVNHYEPYHDSCPYIMVYFPDPITEDMFIKLQNYLLEEYKVYGVTKSTNGSLIWIDL
jgi:hypothetical protein